MPYVITTSNMEAGTASGIARSQSRVAVATLEEARQSVWEIADERDTTGRDVEGPVLACRSLTESGGTIGPLPDGTIIEVKPILPSDLWRAVGQPGDMHARGLDYLLHAFNAS